MAKCAYCNAVPATEHWGDDHVCDGCLAALLQEVADTKEAEAATDGA